MRNGVAVAHGPDQLPKLIHPKVPMVTPTPSNGRYAGCMSTAGGRSVRP